MQEITLGIAVVALVISIMAFRNVIKNRREVMVLRFEDVMTTGEAAELWGKNPTTIKHLCTGIAGKWGPKLTSDECRKSGSAWLVTRAAMERLYGPMPAKKAD